MCILDNSQPTKRRPSIHGWIDVVPRSAELTPALKPVCKPGSLKHVNFAAGVSVPTPKQSKRSAVVLRAAVDVKRGRVLHLFSGPSTRADSLAFFLREKGWEVDDYDCKCNRDSEQDICADHVWDKISSKLRDGDYKFVIAGTPCETFSHARHVPPGPRPLRSLEELYGFKHGLSGKEKEEVRIANLCVARTAEACRLVAASGGGFLIENPRPWPGFETMWLLDEMQSLQSDLGAKTVDFDQCMWGAETTKPTRVMYLRCQGEMLAKQCNHQLQSWVDAKGKHYWAAHERPIQRFRDNGEFATKALGAWPKQLNQAFALLIHHSSSSGAFQ